MQGDSIIWGLADPFFFLLYLPASLPCHLLQAQGWDIHPRQTSLESLGLKMSHPVTNAYSQRRVCAYGYCSREHV